MRFQPPRPKNDEERILPLVNVVFLLLIFFMLAGRLAASDPFRIEPPRSTSEGLVEPQETLVLLGADGRLALDGEMLDEAALKAAVAARMASAAPPRVRLKADGHAEATRVVAVMELLRAAGVERLKLLTVPDTR
jgi:biopolymer transport protein ExbD